MVNPAENEPTLSDINRKLDNLADKFNGLTDKFNGLNNELSKLTGDVERSSEETRRFNDRFGNYQQATQWVVQLAFTLIASATLTVIITAVFKR